MNTPESTVSSGSASAPKRKRRRFNSRTREMFLAGWPLLPYADGAKAPLVSGYHGEKRKRATREDIRSWIEKWPDANPGLVLPDNVIGLDVDDKSHGEGVNGLDAIKEFERRFGPLPEVGHIFHGYTDDGEPSPYGAYLYRMPDELLDVYTRGNVHGDLSKVTGIKGVDIIAPWLRYYAAPGAVHPKTGEVYEFAGGTLPSPDTLPVLSMRQAEALLKRTTAARAVKQIVGATARKTGKARVEELLAQTRALAALPENTTMLIEGEQRGWQEGGGGFYVLACAVARAAENREEIRKAFLEAAEPYDDAERQWDNAVAAVEAEEAEILGDTEPYSVSVNVEPYKFAAEMIDREFRNDDGVLTLRFGHDDRKFWLWDSKSARYRMLTEDDVRARVAKILVNAVETVKVEGGPPEYRPVKVKTKTWVDIVASLQVLTLTSEHGAGGLLPSKGGVPFLNGWLNVETRELEPTGPHRDIRWNVPIDYTPGGSNGDDVWAAFKASSLYDATAEAEVIEKAWQRFLRAKTTRERFATAPLLWLWFLSTLGWLPDTDEYRLLRQWYGYLLSGSLRQEKALMMVGPKRAGKGTILRVAHGLLGDGAVGTQLDKFEANFGMENLIGAGLATVGDARFNRGKHAKMSSKLLSVIAGDEVTVDVKYGKALHLVLDARLMVATNTLPAIIDSSDALPSRFMFLKFTRSFYGVEDKTLKKRLVMGLDKIVRWALAGLDDLTGLGSFTETAAGREQREQMERNSAPTRVFVEDCCELDPSAKATNEELFRAYLAWAEHTKVRFRLSEQELAQDLLENYPADIGNVGSIKRGKTTKRGKRGIRVVHVPTLDHLDD